MGTVALTISENSIVAIGAAIVAIAVPLNTALLVVLNRRQKQSNHHLRTIALRDDTIKGLREEADDIRKTAESSRRDRRSGD